MEPNGDMVVERVARARQLVYWRAAAIVLFMLALFGPVASHLARHPAVLGVPHIAKLRIHGVITDDTAETVAALDRAAHDTATRGLLLRIESPGGAVTGGEALHDAIVRFAARKPVVVSMGGLAASAGYMIAVPAARIFAMPSTLTGSIGVIMESPEFSGLLGKLGVSVDTIVSGPLKGQPSPTAPLTPEGREMLQGVVNDLFGQFVSMVAQGRHMTTDHVRSLADGRPYTGQQALALGLVDQIGTEADATAWLRKRLGASDVHAMPVSPLLRPDGLRPWYRRLAPRNIVTVLPGSQALASARAWLGLDGPVAILQP